MNYSKATLQTLMNLVAKTSKEKPGLGRRLSAAYDIVLSGKVKACDWHDGDHWVTSSEAPKEGEKLVTYRVTDNSCSCPDFVWRETKACKHRLAVRLFLVAEAEERAEESRRLSLNECAEYPVYKAPPLPKNQPLAQGLEDRCRELERNNQALLKKASAN